MAFLGPALALTLLSRPGISQTMAVACMTAALGITSLGERTSCSPMPSHPADEVHSHKSQAEPIDAAAECDMSILAFARHYNQIGLLF